MEDQIVFWGFSFSHLVVSRLQESVLGGHKRRQREHEEDRHVVYE